jgi:hypothetical protein
MTFKKKISRRSSPSKTEMSYQIFISFRFTEGGNEANALKSALEAKGISTYLCAVLPGGDIPREIIAALHGCQLAIIMGTKTYGTNTGVGYSTFEELRYIHEQKKPFFLVKMCQKFEEQETIFRLGNSISYLEWVCGRPMPEDLVIKILQKLASLTGGKLLSNRIVKDTKPQHSNDPPASWNVRKLFSLAMNIFFDFHCPYRYTWTEDLIGFTGNVARLGCGYCYFIAGIALLPSPLVRVVLQSEKTILFPLFTGTVLLSTWIRNPFHFILVPVSMYVIERYRSN